jgi:hypothetical protein
VIMNTPNHAVLRCPVAGRLPSIAWEVLTGVSVGNGGRETRRPNVHSHFCPLPFAFYGGRKLRTESSVVSREDSHGAGQLTK